MLKFLGFALICLWTGMTFLLGYLLGDRNHTQQPIPLIIENRCEQPKPSVEYVYIHIENSMCSIEDDFANEIHEYEMHEDEIDENEIDEDESLEIEQIIFTVPKPPTAQILFGYQKSGAFETKLNFPVSDKFGLYLGYDTNNQYSAGASINLF